jgi:UDP-GlcNAc3NAcA epimerase
MKILTILGARPQFIKAGTVSREIAKYKDIEEIIVHTGQHYDANMSDIFFKEMQIPKPNYFLGIGGKSHGAMTGQMIEKIEEVALQEKPNWIMVYGDTNSTLAGSIVASKLHIKLAHIEAGLRSFNMKMPEEINRILTDRVSNILFCPTNRAVQNLKNEGFDNFDCKIINSGDVMYDGAMFYKDLARKPQLNIEDDFILCTIHRAENTDNKERLISIFKAINEIAKDKQIILPLHPRTKKIIEELKIDTSRITIIEPVGYLEMIWFISNCLLVITDSGGLQKEAFFFEKPCITLRDETEWIELVDNKFNILAGANQEKILDTYQNYLSIFNFEFSLNLYGEGSASENIINNLYKS